jgi:uncharacterized protein
MEKRFITYEQYHSLIDHVISSVKSSTFKPDFVLGISRGGLLLADGLSRALGVPMAVVAASSYREGEGTVQGDLKISSSIASVSPVRGNVLLADDLVDSGATMQALVTHLAQDYPAIKAIQTAVIWHKSTSSFNPNFFSELLEYSVWIVQPFEVRDRPNYLVT